MPHTTEQASHSQLMGRRNGVRMLIHFSTRGSTVTRKASKHPPPPPHWKRRFVKRIEGMGREREKMEDGILTVLDKKGIRARQSEAWRESNNMGGNWHKRGPKIHHHRHGLYACEKEKEKTRHACPKSHQTVFSFEIRALDARARSVSS